MLPDGTLSVVERRIGHADIADAAQFQAACEIPFQIPAGKPTAQGGQVSLAQKIKKALAKDPDNRYQTCGDLLKALRSYREVAGNQMAAAKRVPAATTRVGATASQITSQRRGLPVQSQPKKSAYLWFALLVILVLGTAGYFSWLHIHDLLQRSGPTLNTPPPQPAPSPAPTP